MATIDECVYGQEPAQLQLNKLRRDNEELKAKVALYEQIIKESEQMVDNMMEIADASLRS